MSKKDDLAEIEKLQAQIEELLAEAPPKKKAKKREPATEENTLVVKTEESNVQRLKRVEKKRNRRKSQKSIDEGNAIRYKKRSPLNETESKFLSKFYYEKGYGGRDVLYKLIETHYNKENTPADERISRRRLSDWLSKQEVSQLHQPLSKTSESIKPINVPYKLAACQCDLIIKGGDSLRKYKGVLCCIDVATRMAFTEVLTSTKSKDVANAFEKIQKRVFDTLPAVDQKLKRTNNSNGKSKTFSICQTDNGAEFKKDFSEMLKRLNIRQSYGVANRSTSQAIVEAFNGSLFKSMQKEITATGANWYDITSKFTDLYNNKSHRLLRTKKEDDEEFTYHTPKELWEGDRATLTMLYDAKNKVLKQGNRFFDKEKDIKIGQHVRLARMDKKKNPLAKGATQNYTRIVYVIYKIKRPKSAFAARPLLFYVKNLENDKIKNDSNGNPIAYTVKDLLLIPDKVMKPPSGSVVDEKPDVETRSKTKAADGEAEEKEDDADYESDYEPPPKPPPKPKAPKKTKQPTTPDELIGKTLVGKFESFDEKELKVKGEIIAKKKQKKNGKATVSYQVRWAETSKAKYDYNETGWFKKSKILQMLAQK